MTTLTMTTVKVQEPQKWFQIDRTISIPSGDDSKNDDEHKSATTMVSDGTLSVSIPSGKDEINNDTSDDELYLSSV